MKKKIKMIGVFVIMVCALFILPSNVYAVEIDSTESLRELFSGKSATISGSTISLTDDVDLTLVDGVVDLSGDNYTFNLNGHKLTFGEFYIHDGTVTINDTTGTGMIDTLANFLWISEDVKLIINNGTFDYLANEGGEIIIRNGNVDHITNYGKLLIEDGVFGSLGQYGDATIKGGTFTSKRVENEDGTTSDWFTVIDLSMGKTVLSDVTFNSSNLDYALQIQSRESIGNGAINELAADGYLAACGGYRLVSNDYDIDSETGEITYNYVGELTSLHIIKDEVDEIFELIAPNGVWTINALKPKTMSDSDFLLTSVAGDLKIPDGWKITAYAKPGDSFDPEKVSLSLNYITSAYSWTLIESRDVKAVYNEPSTDVIEAVDSVLEVIDEHTNGKHSIETGFRLEDLYLINYLNASSKGIDASLALNFTKDLIKLTNGGNISFKYDSRLGMPSNGLWYYSGGQVIVYYNDIAVDTTVIGLTTNHVLYIPKTNYASEDEIIEAALDRINSYLGINQGITIKVGGRFDSLSNEDFEWNEFGFIDEETSGDNYYNVTINGKTYKFAICMKDESELEVPKYLASDIISNIFIKSNSTLIPLDTAITVKNVINDSIKKVLGTDIYSAFDISLYSKTKGINITKLDNDKFVVSIPVPEKLKNKDITVYYINSKGEKEEHVAKVKDGIASFETNHFSTYVLAPKEIDNPDTGDNILMYIIIPIVSLIGIVSVLYIKRRYN